MTTSPRPTIGFDRYISRKWLEQTLNLVLVGGDITDLREQLRQEIPNEAALKKTTTVLAGTWLRYYPETKKLRSQALTLAPSLTEPERLVLHWGMLLVHYPFFQTTVGIMGRLLRLQGDFRSQEVRERVLEKVSNVGTAPRAVDRIIQSAKDWQVIAEKSKRYYPAKPLVVDDIVLAGWILKAHMLSGVRESWHVPDLLRTSELFPFDLERSGLLALRQSSEFVFSTEGLDRHIVFLQHKAG